LVTQRAVQRLPRWALMLFCGAYVIPGVIGRDPWRNADLSAFGFMVSIATGRSSWWSPTIGGVEAEPALLPYWIGAAFIRALSAWMDPALAARIPFALMLLGVLALTWYSAYHLARTEAAQPLPFAFGGEADPVDYARAIADGALLALIATLGLLQLGHETTPELAQLTCVSMFIYGLAASPYRRHQSRAVMLIALPALAASNAPILAVALGISGMLVCARSNHREAQRFVPWIGASIAITLVLATWAGLWSWNLARYPTYDHWLAIPRLWLWFLWPAWPMALWTLWQWRRQVLNRHIAIPLACAAVIVAASHLGGVGDRMLLLSLPAWALLAAFALPTLRRSTAAAVDWFSVCFFTVFAAAIWVIYASLQTGVPAQPAMNVVKLSPGLAWHFSGLALLAAAIATVCWLALVRWRTGRNQHALWKSLVLPASGVALCWLLLMSLLLPVVDHARSFKPLVMRVARHVPTDQCLSTPGVQRSLQAGLEYFGGLQVDGAHSLESTTCRYLLRLEAKRRPAVPPIGWERIAREVQTTDRNEWAMVYRRLAVSPASR
jgi:hypothetical protein